MMKYDTRLLHNKLVASFSIPSVSIKTVKITNNALAVENASKSSGGTRNICECERCDVVLKIPRFGHQ